MESTKGGTSQGSWRPRFERTRHRVGKALVTAFAVRHVRRGMIGTALIALGSLTPAFLPANSPWWKLVWNLHPADWLAPGLGTVAALLGIALVMDSWFQIRPRLHGPRMDYRAVLALWSFPMMLAPPIFSHDAYAYAAEGYMIHVGANPYEMGPGMLPGRWADQVVEDWRFTRAPYGPLALQLNHLVVDLFAHSPYWSASLGMRLLTIAGMVAVAVAVPELARRLGVNSQQAMWFGLVNPLTVTHIIGGAHNDGVMIGLVAIGLLLAARGRFLIGCAFVAAGAAVKLPGILAIVPVAILALPILRPSANRIMLLWQAAWRVMAGTAVMAFVFMFITLVCDLGWGWIEAINVPGMVSTIAPSTMLGELARAVMNGLEMYVPAQGVVRIFRQTGMAIMVIVILYFLIRYGPTRPMRFMVFAFIALALGSPALHPWYLTWPAVFFAFAKTSPTFIRVACWSSVALLTYSAVSFSWRNDTIAVGIAAIGAFLWIVWGHDRENFREPVPPVVHEPVRPPERHDEPV